MTKTEYREYINSADWQTRRKEFLQYNNSCERCDIPRWLAEIAYDQDLNVHHTSYKNLGDEEWDDLESLCRRCHEIEKFGRSDLREPKSAICDSCEEKHWDPYSNKCYACDKADLFFVGCKLCGSLIWRMPQDDTKLCGICQGIAKGDPRLIWEMSTKPFIEKDLVGDVILFAVLARFGTDRILESLSSLERRAYNYNLKKIEQKEKEENEIPF